MNARAAALAGVLAAVYALALWARLPAVEGASLGSDAITMFTRAWSLDWGHWPRPPNPEAGYALWLWVWPLVKVATSLKALFTLRFAQGALIAPLGAWAAARLAPHNKPLAALLAGTLLALDPGLIDTLVVAFRGYGAPELAALTLLALTFGPRGRLLALASALLALGQHPYGLGVAVGATAALLVSTRDRDERIRLLILAGVLLTPRLLRTAQLADCGQGPWVCLSTIATGSAEPDTARLDILWRAVHDRFAVEWGPLWMMLPVGLLLAPRRDRRPWALLLVGLGAILVLGLSLSTFRSYHLRIFAAPIAILVGAGLCRWWPLGLAALAWTALRWAPLPPPVEDPGAPARADALAARLLEAPGPLWVDAAYFDRPVGLEPAPIVLAALLQGADPARFSPTPTARLALLTSDHPDANGALWAEGRYALRLFDDKAAAQRWLAQTQPPPTEVGRAADWVGMLYPEEADRYALSW